MGYKGKIPAAAAFFVLLLQIIPTPPLSRAENEKADYASLAPRPGTHSDICGDLTGDSDINLLDILMLIDYVYGDGPAPANSWSADVNDCDGEINLSDILFMIDFIYALGPPPNCCPNEGEFTFEAKYTYIRSYHDGGGIFVVYIVPDKDFSGYAALAIEADTGLHAKIEPDVLTADSPVAEITIRPDSSVKMQTYEIKVTASHQDSTVTIMLEIDMFNWSSAGITEALLKREPLVTWLETEHPEFGSFAGLPWYAYMTYPQILVVEHWTFLYNEWEMRICYHVMIPPHDWSMIWLRRRGEIDAVIAARRESDGTTYEIPISEYPTFYGY